MPQAVLASAGCQLGLRSEPREHLIVGKAAILLTRQPKIPLDGHPAEFASECDITLEQVVIADASLKGVRLEPRLSQRISPALPVPAKPISIADAGVPLEGLDPERSAVVLDASPPDLV